MGREDNIDNKTSTDDPDASDSPKGGRPGPVDGGGSGGMATRENAPEIAED